MRSPSIFARSVGVAEVVVVDNASGDGSPERIEQVVRREQWDWCRVIRAERNGGFACGNNLGWALVRDARYVLLLNSDTIVHSGCLSQSLKYMEQHDSIGAMSCRVLNADGSIQNVARRVPTPLNQLVSALGLPWYLPGAFAWADTEDPGWDRNSAARDVGWLGGAFMLLRGDVVRRIGLLDEAFFFYGEDIEFCHRLRRSGWRVHYAPVGTITHLGGASSDPTRLPASQRLAHRWAARYLVQRKCHGAWAAALVRLIDVLAYRTRFLLAGLGGSRSEEKRRELAFSLQGILRA